MTITNPYQVDVKALDAAIAAIQSAPGGMDGYLHSVIPCPTDEHISAAIERFILREPVHYKRLQALGAFGGIYGYFSAYALRMAIESVRKGSRDLLVRALVGNAVEIGGIDDYRYGLITTSVVYRAAEKLGVDLPQVLTEAGDLCNATGAFLQFHERPETNRRMEAMGYYEGDSPAGILFWPDPANAPETWRKAPGASQAGDKSD